MTWAGKGSTRTWRATRLRVLNRDGWLCQLQLPGCTGRATAVHHKQGRGVSELDRDLESCCQACNNQVGDPTKGDPAIETRTKW